MNSKIKVMTTYYCETKSPIYCYSFKAGSDEEALVKAHKRYPDLMILFREDNTPRGLPFVTLWEHSER